MTMETNKFRDELASLINRNSMENGSDTPDFMLAEYLTNCLMAFDTIVVARDKWYGRKSPSTGEPEPTGGPSPVTPEDSDGTHNRCFHCGSQADECVCDGGIGR